MLASFPRQTQAVPGVRRRLSSVGCPLVGLRRPTRDAWLAIISPPPMMPMDSHMVSSQRPLHQPVVRTAQTYSTIVLNRWIPSPLALQQVEAPPRLVIASY